MRFFLGLLRGSEGTPSPELNGNVNGALKSLGTDKVFLEDFRVAFAVSNPIFFIGVVISDSPCGVALPIDISQ